MMKCNDLILLTVLSLIKIQWVQATLKTPASTRFVGYKGNSPVCHPPCENGGICHIHNQCECTKNYRGSRCQYPVSLCDFSRLRRNNVIADCKHLTGYTDCHISCPLGLTLSPPEASWLRCTVDGMWSPPITPTCVNEIDQCPKFNAPTRGRKLCSMRNGKWTCSLSCQNGFQFPNGRTEQEVTCFANVGVWSPTVIFEYCTRISREEPVKAYKQESSGRSSTSHTERKSHSNSYYSSPRSDTKLEQKCKSPSAPVHGTIRCHQNPSVLQCSASCLSGYTFDQGFRELSLMCVKLTGEWTPEDQFPDCKAQCECLNGGKCLSPNSCLCPHGFRGHQCQYPLSLCAPKNRLASVVYSCQDGRQESTCQVWCPRGQSLLPGHITEYKCRSNGSWTPNVQPRCISSVTDVFSSRPANGYSPKSNEHERKNIWMANSSQQQTYLRNQPRSDVSHRQGFVKSKI